MLSSQDRGFVFVHIQKTGGASVDELLRNKVPDITYHGPRHMTANQAIEKVEDWEQYFKFVFVRNPWDRLVSWYSMIDKGRKKYAPDSLTEARQRRLRRNVLLRHALENAATFEDFVKNSGEELKARDGSLVSFAYNQLDYLTDESGNLLVDFIGRFEHFAEDLTAVSNKLGLNMDDIPHRNSSRHTHYSAFYTAETEEIVRKSFAKDIEYFGYEFERVKSPDSQDQPL